MKLKPYRAKTTYFLSEGKGNIEDCLKLSFNHARLAGIQKIIIFTANGEGLERGCKDFLSRPEFHNIKMIGVSFPYGTFSPEALQIPHERQDLLNHYAIPVLRAAFPWDDHVTNTKSVAHRVLDIFSGGMFFCLNSVLIACDQGFVGPGEHVIAMSADTSLLLKASPSSKALTGLVVREIICKPLIQDITKGESLGVEVNVEALLKDRRNRTKTLSTSSKPAKPKEIGDM